MAFYQDPNVLLPMAHDVFNASYGPGHVVPHSGIYKCTGCGKEIAANAGDPLPPQNRHQHNVLHGPVNWKLVVWSEY